MGGYLHRLYDGMTDSEKFALILLSFSLFLGECYGYPPRMSILTDVVKNWASVSPILFAFLAYYSLKLFFVRIAWTAFFAGISAFISLSIFYGDIKIEGIPEFSAHLLMLCLSIWLVLTLRNILRYGIPKINATNYFFIPLSKVLKFARSWAPLFIIIFCYCHIKVLIPSFTSRSFDQFFYDLDYYLFLKNVPAEWLFSILGETIAPLLSFSYVFYFLLKIFGLSIVYARAKEPRVFDTMIIAVGTTYMFGIVVYIMFPALGPVYYYPEIFENYREAIGQTKINYMQASLWLHYVQMTQHPPLEFYRLVLDSGIRNGIAAFPSLHVAVSCVMFYYLYYYGRFWFWIFIPLFLLMTVATVYFGWHYFVDDIAGLFLAYFVIWGIKKLKFPCPT